MRQNLRLRDCLHHLQFADFESTSQKELWKEDTVFGAAAYEDALGCVGVAFGVPGETVASRGFYSDDIGVGDIFYRSRLYDIRDELPQHTPGFQR